MNRKKNGFTLVEMLIVVLIVGILAAAALPTYRVAVAKSRITAVLPILRKIREAQQMYFVENRMPTCNLANLNIKVDYAKGEPRKYNVTVNGEETGEKYEGICGWNMDSAGNVLSSSGNEVIQNYADSSEDIELTNGIRKSDLGSNWLYVLRNKDTLSMGAHKIIYGDASNNVTIDYHLLGTTGDLEGQWSYTGCKPQYNRCDATCTARYENSVWGKVCKALSNGKCGHKDASYCAAREGDAKGNTYCIGGDSPSPYGCRN